MSLHLLEDSGLELCAIPMGSRYASLAHVASQRALTNSGVFAKAQTG